MKSVHVTHVIYVHRPNNVIKKSTLSMEFFNLSYRTTNPTESLVKYATHTFSARAFHS